MGACGLSCPQCLRSRDGNHRTATKAEKSKNMVDALAGRCRGCINPSLITCGRCEVSEYYGEYAKNVR